MAADGSAAPTMIMQASTTPHYIDGRFEAGAGRPFTLHNPSNEAPVAEIVGASLEQAAAAIAAAKRAVRSGPWATMPRAERIALLRRFVAALRLDAEELRNVLVAEAGCPGGAGPMTRMVMAVQVDVPMKQADEVLDLFLTLPEARDNPVPLADRITPFGKQVQSVMRYVPVGVVAAIAAYNYPFFTAMWKVIPALATGNSVILRPSPLTPVSALIFARAAARAGLPAGVMNLLIEEGTEGAHLLTTHPDVDMVAFTGSTEIGKAVMRQAADTMKRLQLELGGKSAQIFLPDAVDQAAGQAVGVCLAHAGQGCVLGTRIFVPEERKAEVLAQTRAMLGDVRIGEASDPETQLGPVISAAQVARCERFVKLAVEAGATVVVGGKRPDAPPRGHYFEATVLDVPDNANLAAQEEIFGPVVVIIGYRDVDHAVEMANDSPYGLSGYVFGNDKAQCLAVASRLRTGVVNVNGGFSSSYVSGGGHRLSGIGRERGEEGLRVYQQMTAINLSA